MNLQLTIKNYTTYKKAFAFFTLIAVSLVLLTIIQDFVRACIGMSAFYFSEAFMFSSFWWIFIPLLYCQYYLVQIKNLNNIAFKALILIPIFLHLYAFPFLVWGMSKLFYYHTYEIEQTLRYTLSEHLYQLIFAYSIPIIVYQYLHSQSETLATVSGSNIQISEPNYETSIMVSEGNTRKSIAVTDILYLTASTPYINIYVNGKKYLKSETLKSMSEKLNVSIFVRVHKSTIVNIKQVQLFTSRLNGDYDVRMSDGAQLRVSRNFASDFKKKFVESHRFTTK